MEGLCGCTPSFLLERRIGSVQEGLCGNPEGFRGGGGNMEGRFQLKL